MIKGFQLSVCVFFYVSYSNLQECSCSVLYYNNSRVFKPFGENVWSCENVFQRNIPLTFSLLGERNCNIIYILYKLNLKSFFFKIRIFPVIQIFNNKNTEIIGCLFNSFNFSLQEVLCLPRRHQKMSFKVWWASLDTLTMVNTPILAE